ncbi:MAG TPA: protein kinase, partial [Pseudonocardiaceae bacterium]|nr:protein kinase [Pseudonocardiaceae bacterium]
ADVYSLGLVLLECLTGQLEYPGVSKVESALARLHRPPKLPADLPSALADLLARMTALSPADRPTAADCVARLMAIRDGVGPTDRISGLTRVGKPLFVGWRRLAVAGSGLAIAIIASAWMLTSLLPRLTPSVPITATRPHGTTDSGPAPRAAVPQGAVVIHVATPMNPGQPGDGAGLSTDPTTPGTTTTAVPVIAPPKFGSDTGTTTQAPQPTLRNAPATGGQTPTTSPSPTTQHHPGHGNHHTRNTGVPPTS